MSKTKKIFIILFTFILLLSFCSSSFAGNITDGRFDRFLNQHVLYREIDGEKYPAFAIPWQVRDWITQLPEYEQIENGELGLFAFLCPEKDKYSWLFWVLPKDAQVYIQYYSGVEYLKITTYRTLNVYRAGLVTSSSFGSDYLSKDNWEDAPTKIGDYWTINDTTFCYKKINGERCYFAYCSVPFYSDEYRTNLFFQGGHLITDKVTLMNPMSVAEIPEMITKMATILTKVGLIMLSLFLLIYLIRYKMFL